MQKKTLLVMSILFVLLFSVGISIVHGAEDKDDSESYEVFEEKEVAEEQIKFFEILYSPETDVLIVGVEDTNDEEKRDLFLQDARGYVDVRIESPLDGTSFDGPIVDVQFKFLLDVGVNGQINCFLESNGEVTIYQSRVIKSVNGVYDSFTDAANPYNVMTKSFSEGTHDVKIYCSKIFAGGIGPNKGEDVVQFTVNPAPIILEGVEFASQQSSRGSSFRPEQISCEEWSACLEGQQFRVCLNRQADGEIIEISESQACELEVSQAQGLLGALTAAVIGENGQLRPLGGIILFVLIVGVVGLVVYFRRK